MNDFLTSVLLILLFTGWVNLKYFKFFSLLQIPSEFFPTVTSGIKQLHVLKTTQSSFVNFVNDEYRTLPDQADRIFSTIVDCNWEYRKVPDIDYDKSFDLVKHCILRNFAGDLDHGTPSPSVQNTLYMAEKEALENVPSINSIEMTMPNKHYINFDFSQLKGVEEGDVNDTVFLPLVKPSGVIYGKLDRKSSKLWGKWVRYVLFIAIWLCHSPEILPVAGLGKNKVLILWTEHFSLF